MYAKSNHMVQAFIKTKYKTNHSVAYESRAASASAGCSAFSVLASSVVASAVSAETCASST